MKKWLKLLALIGICFIIYFIYQKTYNSIYQITNIGDNLSQGITSYGIKEYSYINYYQDYLEQQKGKVILNNNYSNKSQTIKRTLDQIKETTEMKRTLYDSNLIVITLGYNDLIYSLSMEEKMNQNKLDRILKEIQKNYQELIKEIRKYYHEKIIVIGYYQDYSNEYYKNIGIQRLNKILKSNKDVIYINTYDLVKKRDNFFNNPNSNYLNREGYKAIAQKIIEKTLEKKQNI